MTDWRVASETGPLRDVLLCRPDHYRWQPINAVGQRTLVANTNLDHQRLMNAYGEFEDAFDRAGVTRHYLVPESQLPYQAYTRDSSQMTPWGVVICQMYRPVRRGEYAAVIKFYQGQGIPIWNWSTAGTLEGGDIHVIRPGLLLVGYSDDRTDRAGAEQLAVWFQAEGWEVRLQPFDPHFLHLDLLFCMVTDRLAVACLDVLEDDLVAWLRRHRIELLDISYREAMALGCNLLALGDDRVISPLGSKDLNAKLRAAGIEVLDPDLELFTLGGGGAHCLSMPLRRDPL